MYTRLLKITVSVLVIFISVALIAQNQHANVSKAIFMGKSEAVRNMEVVIPGIHQEQYVVKNFMSKEKELPFNVFHTDRFSPNIQRNQGNRSGRGPILNFEGVDNVNGVYPADTNGDVSDQYYMQSVNNAFALWDKSGNLLYGPVDNNSLWLSLPGPWHQFHWSDPVFKYDYMSDRWVISSMSYSINQEIFYEMVAVSESNDPLGAYNCYAIEFDGVNDYPKISIWPDGYYITYNLYENPISFPFLYSLVTVVDKEAMIAGEEEVTIIEFEIPDPDIDRFFPIAADMRGNIVYDIPNYVVTVDNPDTLEPWYLSLDVYEVNTDWNDLEASTFNKVAQFDIGQVFPIINSGPGAPQPINNKNVVTIPLFMMYPVTYRDFGTHESMVCTFTMYDGEQHYPIWYELRKEDAEWYVYQQGSYAPDESHRYQPSIAINANGDIAMGYTVSDEETFPSVRMTGRRAGDPLGEMTYMEMELFTGLNYINTYHDLFDQNRWGDYASMMVDPANDTTFWFTNMYPKSEANVGNWGTRIFALDLTEEFENVTAYAGNDTTIEPSDYIYTTSGEATNYNAIEWFTTGDGSFLTNGILNSKYVRGNQDITNGQVRLIIQANGYEPGSFAKDTMTLTIGTQTGIEELTSNNLEFSISPNPTHGMAAVNANVGISKKVILSVFDSYGKLLFREERITKSENYKRKLDFSFKDAGVYLCRLQVGYQVANTKVVLMK